MSRWPATHPPAAFAALDETGCRERAQAAHDRVKADARCHSDPRRPAPSPGGNCLQHLAHHRVELVAWQHRAAGAARRFIAGKREHFYHVPGPLAVTLPALAVI